MKDQIQVQQLIQIEELEEKIAPGAFIPNGHGNPSLGGGGPLTIVWDELS